MGRERNALKAGIFIVISIALMFAVSILIRGTIMETRQVRYVTFSLEDDLGGLRIGDDVRIGGYKVGEVRAIDVVSPSDSRLTKAPATAPARTANMLLVTVVLPQRFELRQGLKVGIQSTVTGQSCMNFSSLGSGARLPDDAPLRGAPSAYTVVVNSLSDIGPKINSIARKLDEQTVPSANEILARVRDETVPNVNRTIDTYRGTAESATALLAEVRKHIEPIMKKYHQMADSTSGMMNEVRDIFGDTKSDFRGTMKNLHSATGTVNEKLPGIMDKFSALLGDTRTAITKAGEALEDVQSTAANAREFSGDLKTIVASNRSTLNTITRHLKGTALNLELGSAEIRSRPWRLLYTPKKDEANNLVLFDSAREFARGANELNDAAQALRDALKDQKDPEEIRKLMDRVEKSFRNFNEVEQKLWKAVK